LHIAIQFIRLVIGFSDVATLAREIRHKILLRVSILTTFLHAGGLTYVNNIFTTKQAMLHVSQLVRITCAAAAKIAAAAASVNFGWRGGAPNFFPAAAARQGAGWRRRRNRRFAYSDFLKRSSKG